MTAVVAAVLAAACFAVAGTLQHSSASASPSSTPGHLGLGLLLRLLGDRTWMAGLAVAAAGLALHAYALSVGQLLVVQPLLVSGLVLALGTAAAADRRLLTRREVGWGGAVVVGLAGYLLTARPGAGVATAPDARLLPALGLVVLPAVLCVLAARRLPGAAALLLGSAAGCCFGMTAALLKQLTGVLAAGPSALLTSWPLYALAVVGTVGIALAQSAYQAGALAASVPALTVVEPVVAAVVGALAFGELPRTSPVALLAQAAALALMVLGVVRLAPDLPHDSPLPALEEPRP